MAPYYPIGQLLNLDRHFRARQKLPLFPSSHCLIGDTHPGSEGVSVQLMKLAVDFDRMHNHQYKKRIAICQLVLDGAMKCCIMKLPTFTGEAKPEASAHCQTEGNGDGFMGAVALGGSESLVPRNADGHDRTSGSVSASGEMTQINNRSGKARLPGPRPPDCRRRFMACGSMETLNTMLGNDWERHGVPMGPGRSSARPTCRPSP